MLWSPLIISLVLYSELVSGNTEIRNFRVLPSLDDTSVLSDPGIPLIGPKNSTTHWSIPPAPFGSVIDTICKPFEQDCEHQVLLKLDLSAKDWSSFDSFTVRVSWPGSSPADFVIEVLDPPEALAYFSASQLQDGHSEKKSRQPRVKYIVIRVLDTGVLTPHDSAHHQSRVPFVLLVEPLYFRVLPASLVPLLCFYFLPLISLLSWFLLPKVDLAVRKLSVLSQRELYYTEKKKKKKQ